MGMLYRIRTWNTRANWLFLFAAIGGGRTLWEWLFKPQGGTEIMPFGCPPCQQPIWPMALSAITLAMCGIGFYLSAKREAQFGAEKGKRLNAEKHLRDAESPLIFAGKLGFLADDAAWICEELLCLMQHGTLASSFVRGLNGHEPVLERLRIHRMQVKAMPLTEFSSEIMGTTKPEELKASAVVAMLGDHENALRNKCAQLIDPYLKAVR
jgi:hypothetical protein